MIDRHRHVVGNVKHEHAAEITSIISITALLFQYEARLVANLPLFLRAWVDALVVKRAAVFNTDQVGGFTY